MSKFDQPEQDLRAIAQAEGLGEAGGKLLASYLNSAYPIVQFSAAVALNKSETGRVQLRMAATSANDGILPAIVSLLMACDRAPGGKEFFRKSESLSGGESIISKLLLLTSRIGIESDSIAFITKYLTDTDLALRIMALDALYNINEQSADAIILRTKPEVDELRDLYVEAVIGRNDMSLNRECKTVKLEAALTSNVLYLRDVAWRLAATLKLQPRFIEKMKALNVETLASVLIGISANDYLIGSDVFVEFLDHSSPRIRIIAVTSLGLKKDGLDRGLHLVQDNNPSVRFALARALRNAKDEAGLYTLERLAKDPSAAVRAEAERHLSSYES